MKKYTPPFSVTSEILKLLQDIAWEIGVLEGRKLVEIPLRLRRENSIKTIQASLAIEGNTLTIDQITAVLEGKRVLAPLREVTEIKNALNLYESLMDFNPLSPDDLLKAHAMLMQSLVDENGKWRTKDVGVLKSGHISHVAPPSKRVQALMLDLFSYLQTTDTPWILKACIFHYELEFIHPFQDGNGRMGRLWQQLLLMKENLIFRYLPIEVLVKDHQEQYYRSLEESDRAGESTVFIEFMLALIRRSLQDFSKAVIKIPQDSNARLFFAKSRLDKQWFNRKDYLVIHPDISTATASRDLAFGVDHGILTPKGEKNQVCYKFAG